MLFSPCVHVGVGVYGDVFVVVVVIVVGVVGVMDAVCW